jgi:hypothetical protein
MSGFVISPPEQSGSLWRGIIRDRRANGKSYEYFARPNGTVSNIYEIITRGNLTRVADIQAVRSRLKGSSRVKREVEDYLRDHMPRA